jgi:hypothetical protein
MPACNTGLQYRPAIPACNIGLPPACNIGLQYRPAQSVQKEKNGLIIMGQKEKNGGSAGAAAPQAQAPNNNVNIGAVALALQAHLLCRRRPLITILI